MGVQRADMQHRQQVDLPLLLPEQPEHMAYRLEQAADGLTTLLFPCWSCPSRLPYMLELSILSSWHAGGVLPSVFLFLVAEQSIAKLECVLGTPL